LNTLSICHSDLKGAETGVALNAAGTLNWNEGNINADPLFADPANGDFSISEASPCLGSGEEGCNMGYSAETVTSLMRAETFQLLKTWPNPFNPVLQLTFRLDEGAETEWRILDLLGRRVYSSGRVYLEKGEYSRSWSPADHCSGVYIVQLISGKSMSMEKVTYLK